ncbi:MAG: hypothetical protein QM697_16930 [Lachnospiraceae bacterium]
MFGGSILFFTYGFQAMAVVYLLCIKYSKSGFLFSISRQGFIYLPILLLLKQSFGKYGIYFAPAAADGITTLLIVLFLLWTKKKRTVLPNLSCK